MRLIEILLNERNRQTCGKILRTNSMEPLEWREVRSLFAELGQAAWQPNGDLKVTCSGHVIVLRPSTTSEVGRIEERIELRRFLERLEVEEPSRELQIMSA